MVVINSLHNSLKFNKFDHRPGWGIQELSTQTRPNQQWAPHWILIKVLPHLNHQWRTYNLSETRKIKREEKKNTLTSDVSVLVTLTLTLNTRHNTANTKDTTRNTLQAPNQPIAQLFSFHLKGRVTFTMRVSSGVLLGVEGLQPNPHKALELQRSFFTDHWGQTRWDWIRALSHWSCCSRVCVWLLWKVAFWAWETLK